MKNPFKTAPPYEKLNEHEQAAVDRLRAEMEKRGDQEEVIQEATDQIAGRLLRGRWWPDGASREYDKWDKQANRNITTKHADRHDEQLRDRDQALQNRKDALADKLEPLYQRADFETERDVMKRTPMGVRKIDIELSRNNEVVGGVAIQSQNQQYTERNQSKDQWLAAQHYDVDIIRDR